MTRNLNVNANKKAVKPNFSFTPEKKDSTTFFEAEAPAYLNAFRANTRLGIIPIAPPAIADTA